MTVITFGNGNNEFLDPSGNVNNDIITFGKW